MKIEINNWRFFKQNIWAILVIFYSILACKKTEKPLFQELTPNETGVNFVNKLVETQKLNINEFLYAYNGGGVAVGDINNDGKPDIYFSGNQSGNALYLNKTVDNQAITFANITKKAGVAGSISDTNWTTGISMVDVNADGWLDIYINHVSKYKHFTGRNELFINNKNLTFSEKAKEYGLDFEGYCQQTAFFDFDNDGDLDLYQLNLSVHSNEVYQKAEIREKRDPLAGDKLFENQNGFFVDISEKAGIYGGVTGYGLAVAIADLDNNGFSDIYVSNDFHENDYIYYNNGNASGSTPQFSEKSKEVTQQNSNFSMGSDIADINNDGLLDIFTLDMKPNDDIIRKKSADTDPYDVFKFKLGFGYHVQYPRNMFHLNQGILDGKIGNKFSEIGQYLGIDATDWSWATLLTDLDNDGFKDIFVTNGILRRPNDLDYINYTYNDSLRKSTSIKMLEKMPNGAVHNFVYQNKGLENGYILPFFDVSTSWGFDKISYSMGAAYSDFDNDGDLDLALNNLNENASIYTNNSEQITTNNYLKIKLIGANKNTFGIGAKVEIETINGKQIQVLNPVRGWLSSVDYTLNFGLGKALKINKLKVIWPSGFTQIIENIEANKQLILKEINAKSVEILPKKITKNENYWRDITDETQINFTHKENEYSDFSVERLIPQLLSTQGPKLAVADVNGDNLEDFFVCEATNQASSLFIQIQKNGKYSFEKSNQKLFESDKKFEDVDASFFDADGDADLDLVVVAGDGQTNVGVATQDRLYLNDGKGNFSKSKAQFPTLFGNKSTVEIADFNNDKKPDIFIGTRSIVGQYGVSPDSYILINKGNGTFEKATDKKYDVFKELGMVTSAVWNTKTKELIVAGDWMPITILKLDSQGNFTKKIIENTEGWWQNIELADLDNDGDFDILAGNRGLNADMQASINQPVNLMVKDFDQNLNFEPIMSHFRYNEERMWEGLSELKKQMPMIQNKFRSNEFFAVSRLADIFPDGIKKGALFKKVVTFESIKLMNNGGGNYEIVPFSKQFQQAPIASFLANDFNNDGKIDLLSAGNSAAFKPNIGQMMASFGNFLELNQTKNSVLNNAGLSLSNQVRDLKLINFAKTKCVIVANNNGPIQVLKFGKN